MRVDLHISVYYLDGDIEILSPWTVCLTWYTGFYVKLIHRAGSCVNWIMRQSLYVHTVTFETSFQVLAYVAWSIDNASRHPHLKNLLNCANPYETKSWCISYAVGCWYNSSVCWCTSEDLITVAAKHVCFRVLDWIIIGCTSMNEYPKKRRVEYTILGNCITIIPHVPVLMRYIPC